MNESKLHVPRTAGYRTVGKTVLDKITLPPKITCRICNKSKTPGYGFSEKQLDAFKNGVATRQITAVTEAQACWIACRDCSGKQRTEMHCSQCQTWKGLDGFTKAQRRTPDLALCLQCVHFNQIQVPICGRRDRETHGDQNDNSDDETASTYYGQSEAGNSDAGVALPPSQSQLTKENLRAASVTGNATKAWQKYAGVSSTAGTGSARKYTGYDAQGHAHEKTYTPSIADTEESYATTRATPRMTDREIKDMTSKFARLRGPRQELPEPEPYVGGRLEEIEDDPDSDDSYGYI